MVRLIDYRFVETWSSESTVKLIFEHSDLEIDEIKRFLESLRDHKITKIEVNETKFEITTKYIETQFIEFIESIETEYKSNYTNLMLYTFDKDNVKRIISSVLIKFGYNDSDILIKYKYMDLIEQCKLMISQ